MTRPPSVDSAFEAGFSVVPADMNKRPKVPWKPWQTEQQTEEEFGSLGHGSLWGVVTGSLYGVTVLDFDFDAGGEDTLKALDLEPHVVTPGGAHVYVQHPGYPVKNSARSFEQYPGLDIRGDGGLAWFAGRSKKGTYNARLWPPQPIDLDPALAEELFPHPQETAALAPRGEWSGAGHGTPEATRYVTKAAKDIEDADPGTSNKVLNKVAYSVGGLVASGQLDEQWAFDMLLAAAENRGAGEPVTVIEAAMATGSDAPWAFTPDEDEWVPAVTMKVFRRGEVPEPIPFPIEALPEPIDDFTRQAAKAVSAPPDYIGAGVLPALGVALGGYVSLRITDSWKESPLLYVAMVGPPSARKSPSLGLIMQPAYDAEEAMFEDIEEGAWNELSAPALVADDVTMEAFFGVLENNPRGVILAADEITGWVNGMGQYKGGGGRDRQHWLSIWSRKPIKVGRKTTTSHRIPRPFACVLGGIQPEPLEELIQGRDDGLLPRILMAQGEPVTPFLDREVRTVESAARYAETWNRLRDDGMTDRVVEFTDAGYRAFQAWANDHYRNMQRVPKELAGAWGKMDAQAARIALILSAVMGESEVSVDAVDRAIALVTYFQGQAAGLLQGTGNGSRWEKQNYARTMALGRFLIENPGAGRSEIMQAFPWAMDSRTLDRHLEALTDLGLWNG